MSAAVTQEHAGTIRRAPAGPQLGNGPKPGAGPSPFVVLAAGFALGVLLAKWLDWRGHAHPRR
jgi:hypothetical protein